MGWLSLRVLGPEDHGGLKFIRWDYEAENRDELSVQKGEEMILKGTAKENFMKVQSYESRREGLVPKKCFTPRKLVQRSHKAECDNEISVSKGDVIGEIEKNVGGSGMCKVFKSKSGGEFEEGNIPQHCFYPEDDNFDAYRKCCAYLYLIRTMIQALILAGAAYCIQPTADRPDQNRHQPEISEVTPCTSQKRPSQKTKCPCALQLPTAPSNSALPSASKAESHNHVNSNSQSNTSTTHHPTLPVRSLASSPKASNTLGQFRAPTERASDIICLDGKPSMSQIQSLRHANGSEVRIIDEIAPNWYKVAYALDIKISTINIISEDCRGDCVRGCTRMISSWIDSKQDVTWGHLTEALDRADFKVLANDVKSFLR